jgi:hypothetical protein
MGSGFLFSFSSADAVYAVLVHNEKALNQEEAKTVKSMLLLTATAVCAFLATPLSAHEVANFEHTHAFEQTGYGHYRQGHSVNGPQGSIIIWSAQPKNSTNGKAPVDFARPSPITRPPGQSFKRLEPKTDRSDDYGKDTRKDYGNQR